MGDHYIPRLLLRRFLAGKTKGGQAMVFQFQRGEPLPKLPFPVDRVASEQGFYDHPSGVSLDDGGMHAHEKEVAKVLVAIEAGTSPEAYRQDLALMFSVMMGRTRALRDEWTQMIESLLAEGHRAMASPAWNEIMQDGLRNNFQATIGILFKDCDPWLRAQVEALLQRPGGKELLRRQVERLDFSSAADAFMSGLRSSLDYSFYIKKGQVDALLRVFRERSVAWLDNVRFELLSLPQGDVRVVLGDVCVVGLGDDGAFANCAKLGPNCKARFLPIGPHQVLAAVAEGEPCPSVSASALNTASATLSREFFFSAGCGRHEADLLEQVGTASTSLSCEEIREIAEEALGRFPLDGQAGT